MKKSFLFFGLLVSVFMLWSFSTIVEKHQNNNGGINFEASSWQQALDKAKAEKKYVFVDMYASWCGVCKKLKRKSFSDKEVGEYYNKNFINIAIDGESEEGKVIMSNYGLTSYPTLLIVDGNGLLKTKQVGFVEPHVLVNFGKRIVP